MNIALVLSGGTGSRVGTDIPKQYIEVGGRPIISYCLECLTAHDGIDKIQIVADELWHGRIGDYMEGNYRFWEKFCGFSKPGENRQLSIINGLGDIQRYAADSDRVLIHDAARPLLTAETVSACLAAADGHDGVLPVLPMKDTVYGSTDGKTIGSLLNRREIFAGQAPEVFRLGPYLDANRQLLPQRILEINGSTEPAVMAGMDMVMIPGDERNFKITTGGDLERFRRIVEEGKESTDGSMGIASYRRLQA